MGTLRLREGRPSSSPGEKRPQVGLVAPPWRGLRGGARVFRSPPAFCPRGCQEPASLGVPLGSLSKPQEVTDACGYFRSACSGQALGRGQEGGGLSACRATRLGGGRWTGRWTLGGIARVYGALASRASRVLIPALPSPARRPPVPHLVFLIYKRIIMLPPPPHRHPAGNKRMNKCRAFTTEWGTWHELVSLSFLFFSFSPRGCFPDRLVGSGPGPE